MPRALTAKMRLQNRGKGAVIGRGVAEKAVGWKVYSSGPRAGDEAGRHCCYGIIILAIAVSPVTSPQ